MTEERRSDPLFEAWLKDSDPTPPDPSRSVAQVMARVPRTRQRGRWWPFPAFDGPAPIPGTGGRQPARESTLFSALEFVAAAVIVALFGGFLLAGILSTQQGDETTPAAVTEPPSPLTSVRTDLLPGVALTVEQVGPGLYRITSDGARDLASVEAVDIVAGYDGGIWLLREDEFLRVGSEETHGWPTTFGPRDHVFEVTPDGIMWVIPNADAREGPALRSTDGEEWTVQPCPEDSMDCQGLTVAPDGWVWASWEAWDGVWRVSHLGPTGWQALDGDMPDGPSFEPFDRFFVSDAGDIYASGCDPAWFCWLQRYEDGVWKHHRQARNVVAVGPDGTAWDDGGIGIWGNDDPAIPDPPEGLVRLAGGEYANWTSDDLPDIRFGFGLGLDYEFEVAPDGSLWFSIWRSTDGSGQGLDEGSWECDGLAHFDGVTVDRFLPGRCISMDIAADGSVWVVSDSDLYVINPDAETASG